MTASWLIRRVMRESVDEASARVDASMRKDWMDSVTTLNGVMLHWARRLSGKVQLRVRPKDSRFRRLPPNKAGKDLRVVWSTDSLPNG